jgi:perosamine synthetase
MLSVSRPSIGDEELTRVQAVFESGWLGQGSVVREFEQALAAVLKAENVIAVDTGTSALHLALAGLGIGPGDEVIVPSLTFCGGVQAITATGAIPVFCEVIPTSLNMDIGDAMRRVTNRTRAIMPVHYCGNCCDMETLLNEADGRHLRVIEDAAHAFGSSYMGRPVGGFGDVTCFSFDPIKNITCGEGGAIVTSDNKLADKVSRMRILGISQDAWSRQQEARPWAYDVKIQGYRYHMSNINAAIGLAQLTKLSCFRARKRTIVQQYNYHFEVLDGVITLDWSLEDCCPFTYIIRIKHDARDKFCEFLRRRGVGTGVHYIPNHTLEYFQPYASGLPITEQVASEIVTLPLYYDMTDQDVRTVISAVYGYFGLDDREIDERVRI